tara:strand:- start:141 stop:473 length:333 start_codon:yes stop_codon:yes gene_type:complete
MNLNVDPLLTPWYIPCMTVNVNYPLPTIHWNGTSRDMLLRGEMKVHDALNKVSEALEECEFHSRDYYLQDEVQSSYKSYNKAKEERMKHIENLRAFKQYNLEQVMHIRSS